MENWKDVKIDDPSMWPDSHMVELELPHGDDRGEIQSLVNLPMKNVSLISSVRGSVRSNHFHRTDWHYMYVLSGKAEYYYRPAGSEAPAAVLILQPGDMVFTPPMEEHATVFLEDSVFIVMSRNARDQESYEADVERVTLVDPDDVDFS